MVDGLDCLGHHCVVGCHYDDGDVGDLGTAGTHRREGLVTGSVKEGDVTAVRKLHVVSSDVLGDTAGLACDDVGLADVVQQRCLTVVDVTHHGDDRRTFHQFFRLVLFLGYAALGVGVHEFYLVTEFLSHKHESLGVETLVDGHHKTEIHTGFDDLRHRSVVHQDGQVVDGHELGNLEDVARGHFHTVLLFHLLLEEVPLLATVLGALGLALALGHTGVGLLYLLLDFFLVELGFPELERILAAAAAVVASAAAILVA